MRLDSKPRKERRKTPVRQPASGWFLLWLMLVGYPARAEILQTNWARQVVEEGITPRHGDVVTAIIDHERTLKTFISEGGKSFLRAENPRYPQMIPAGELIVQGVMIALIRKRQ